MAQTSMPPVKIQTVEPPNWWVGMQHTALQILVYGSGVGHCRVKINYPGVELMRVTQVENSQYLFLDLQIGPETEAGEIDIRFFQEEQLVLSYPYPLLQRQLDPDAQAGIDAADVIYLIMPDRFANGNPEQDNIEGMLEQVDRSDPNGRHGGDIQGIRDHLDYIKDLGFTSIWINPLLENNMPGYSYHGYAITNFYQIDPRHGSNESYRELVREAHQRGLKVIKDMVLNHCGTRNWWVLDPPEKDWLNQWPAFTRSNYHIRLLTDPYVSQEDKQEMIAGWFDTTMPDLNQRNPLLKTYLIQNTIWWIEYAGLDGIRLDTQPYSYPEMVSEWAQHIRTEYPHFFLVGESWLRQASITAYWQGGGQNADGYDSQIPSVTDFPLHFAVAEAFNEKESWNTGLVRLYNLLGEDFLYPDPQQLLIFPDNHDLSRFYSLVEENMDHYKMALSFLLTTRGIPQIYYGTEILMTGWENEGHGTIREDFPGGWPGDERNAFETGGRTPEEEEAFTFLQKLLSWRKEATPIHHGKLMHFKPQDGVYTYFRFDEKACIMVMINNDPLKEKKVDTRRFKERLKGYNQAKEVISGKSYSDISTITISPKSVLILELE